MPGRPPSPAAQSGRLPQSCFALLRRITPPPPRGLRASQRGKWSLAAGPGASGPRGGAPISRRPISTREARWDRACRPRGGGYSGYARGGRALVLQAELAEGSERRWPRQSWSRRRMMNGIAGTSHIDSRERVLKLGESFEKQPRCAFHTVRCE